MTSTVTTATVAAVMATHGSEGVGRALALIMVVMLGIGLLARELLVVSSSARARRWARGLDIGNAPLLISFAVIAVLNAAMTFGAF
jgi:hypothetical protein